VPLGLYSIRLQSTRSKGLCNAEVTRPYYVYTHNVFDNGVTDYSKSNTREYTSPPVYSLVIRSMERGTSVPLSCWLCVQRYI